MAMVDILEDCTLQWIIFMNVLTTIPPHLSVRILSVARYARYPHGNRHASNAGSEIP